MRSRRGVSEVVAVGVLIVAAVLLASLFYIQLQSGIRSAEEQNVHIRDVVVLEHPSTGTSIWVLRVHVANPSGIDLDCQLTPINITSNTTGNTTRFTVAAGSSSVVDLYFTSNPLDYGVLLSLSCTGAVNPGVGYWDTYVVARDG